MKSERKFEFPTTPLFKESEWAIYDDKKFTYYLKDGAPPEIVKVLRSGKRKEKEKANQNMICKYFPHIRR